MIIFFENDPMQESYMISLYSYLFGFKPADNHNIDLDLV